jgi:hypothetical protein
MYSVKELTLLLLSRHPAEYKRNDRKFNPSVYTKKFLSGYAEKNALLGLHTYHIITLASGLAGDRIMVWKYFPHPPKLTMLPTQTPIPGHLRGAHEMKCGLNHPPHLPQRLKKE